MHDRAPVCVLQVCYAGGMIETGNRDELAFLLVASLVVLAFVAHLHGPGLSSVERLAMLGAVGGALEGEGASEMGEVLEELPIPVCPFVQSSDIRVFEFGDEPLRGVYGPLEFSKQITLLPGTYTVRAFSYDQAHGREHKVAQEYEQWYLDIYLTGTKLATLGPTRDLADGLTLTRSFDTFTDSLALPNGANEIIVRHAHPMRRDNSVVPRCVVFERQ